VIFNKPALFVQKLIYCGLEGTFNPVGPPRLGSPFRPLKMRQKQRLKETTMRRVR
jgi:hypothetical protein